MKISLIALCVWMSAATQSQLFEKRALSAAQQIPASTLDSKLPNRPFAAWFSNIVGQQEEGIVWQLAECGLATGSNGGAQEMRACAEAVVVLPNDGKLVLGISVGTFKSGLVGDPAFLGAVIERGDT